jgi:hypothetical protein
MVGLGLSFGKKKQSSTTDMSKTENVNQSSTQDTTGTTKSAENTSQQGSSSSTGGQTTSTIDNTGKSTTTAGQTTQTGSTLSKDILSGAGDVVTSLLSQVFGGGGDRSQILNGVSTLGDFDIDSFIASGLKTAQNQESSFLDEAIGGLTSLIGGTTSENSNAALLGNKLQGESTARLAATQNQLAGQAYDIAGKNVATSASALNTVGAGAIDSIINAIKGGETTGTATQQGTEQSQSSGGTSATTNTNEQSTNASNTSTQGMQEVAQTIASILQSLTQTTGSEKTTGKSSGMGASLSI